ncbi:hypothetical protein G7Y79_00018g044140 [Physcia stellaris]|nr:hypothetical protein G7Y79_00018g044140 [Physcia stellaris]
MMANVFANVFSPQGTGYIEREELQKRLEELFPGSDRDFKIQHVNDRWTFKTPEKVTAALVGHVGLATLSAYPVSNSASTTSIGSLAGLEMDMSVMCRASLQMSGSAGDPVSGQALPPLITIYKRDVGSQGQSWEEKRKLARETIWDKIREQTFRRSEESGQHKFITEHILEKIWTNERLADVFAEVELPKERYPQCLRESHLKVMSILVATGWTEWPLFKNVFIDQPKRSDKDLPFDEGTFAGSEFGKADAQNFLLSQSMFLPAIFFENKDTDYSSDFRLPFRVQPTIVSDKGSYSSIEKVELVSRQYHDRNGDPNVNHKQLVRKLCYLNDPKQDLREEKDILAKLRDSLFDDSRVMASLGTITHLGTPRTLSIFFPVAEFDLDDYLFGRKTSPYISRFPVDPIHLIKEFACLVHALDYLHTGIRLAEDGERYVCVHHDLKPDNILVVAEDGAPVGRWKVTDFGLSGLKAAESKKSQTGTTFYDRISSVRASLTSPKRRRGTFQPPEIDKAGEKVMGPRSDVWALGCILCLVLMYATGGDSEVEEFQRRRLRQKKTQRSSIEYEHDYFYRDNSINPEVLAPLETKSRLGVWTANCVEVIKKMLQIEPTRRPKAKLVEEWLFDRVVREIRESDVSECSAKAPAPPTSLEEGTQQHHGGHDISSFHEHLALKTTLSSPDLGLPKPEITTAQSVGPKYGLKEWKPYPSIWNPTVSSSFVSFKLDGHVSQTLLSDSAEYVAFLCKANVYVHTIMLLDEKPRWVDRLDRLNKEEVKLSEGTCLTIPAPENTVWRGMSFPGAYLALTGFNKEQQDYVCIYNLSMISSSEISCNRVFTKDRVSNLLGANVSSEGDLVFRYASAFSFHSRRKNWVDPSTFTIPGLKNVAFTLNVPVIQAKEVADHFTINLSNPRTQYLNV